MFFRCDNFDENTVKQNPDHNNFIKFLKKYTSVFKGLG